MKLRKILPWILISFLFICAITYILYNTRVETSQRNKFIIDLDEYYNEDYYLYDIENVHEIDL